MSTESIKEPEIVADFAVKLQSDGVSQVGDPGRSLFTEVTKLQEQVAALRSNVAQLCTAVKALVQLQSVLNQAVKVRLEGGGPSADCAVL
jgi:hypothetical protein